MEKMRRMMQSKKAVAKKSTQIKKNCNLIKLSSIITWLFFQPVFCGD